MTITPSPPGKLPLRLSRDPPSGFPPRQGRSRLPGFGLASGLNLFNNNLDTLKKKIQKDLKIYCSLAQSTITGVPLC